MQQLREKVGFIEALWFRVAAKSQTFLCIFWNFSGGLQDRLLEMSLMVTPYVKYHKLTKVVNKILFPLGQDIEKLRALSFARYC